MVATILASCDLASRDGQFSQEREEVRGHLGTLVSDVKPLRKIAHIMEERGQWNGTRQLPWARHGSEILAQHLPTDPQRGVRRVEGRQPLYGLRMPRRQG